MWPWKNRNSTAFAAVCLDGGQVHAARVTRSRDERPVVHFCRSEPAGASPRAALAKVAQELSLHRYRCITVLPMGDYRMMTIDPPAVPAAEVNEAVRWQIKDSLDFPADQAVLDTLPVASDLAGTPHRASMFAVVAERSRIQARTQSFQTANIPLAVIDVPEMALRNLAHLFEQPGLGAALAWFGASGSGIVFVAAGELCLFRPLDTTAQEVSTALELNDTRVLERTVLGLQRAIDYFERNFSAVPINRVILAPMESGDALQRYLASNLSMPVELADLGRVLDLDAVPDLAQPARLAGVLLTLGAALRNDVHS